jgi:predicted pyridoxine 5'-phosphate oxidase superfamily flavin-nucleotide-binding protein
MSQSYGGIAFTAGVKAAQRHYGGVEHGAGAAHRPRSELGAREMEFIAARDSFYMATVGEGGWPYVQHRGGPAGFLKVLGSASLGFADFSGNRQYISAGNLGHDGRLSLILVDYAERRRLKIFGRASQVDAAGAPADLLMQVAPATGDGVCIERLVLIRVEAFDWNCSQHITPRYTEAEWRSRLAEELQTHHHKE